MQPADGNGRRVVVLRLEHSDQGWSGGHKYVSEPDSIDTADNRLGREILSFVELVAR